jgi:hypothetical protein
MEIYFKVVYEFLRSLSIISFIRNGAQITPPRLLMNKLAGEPKIPYFARMMNSIPAKNSRTLTPARHIRAAVGIAQVYKQQVCRVARLI